MTLTPDVTTSAELIRRLLDRGYTQSAGAAINAIAGSTNNPNGLIQQRLAELDAEAARLAGEGKKLTPDNPVARALMADFDDAMRGNGALVNNVAGDVQTTGVNASGPVTRQTALPGLTDASLAQIGIAWNVPDPEAVNSLVNMVSDPAFVEKLARYTGGTPEQVQNVLINAFVAGKGPIASARLLRQAVEGLPAHHANQLLRTLQLTAFRDGQRVHRISNAHILEYQIRYATLDNRTCMACISLHGERLPIEARIDDHHQGRCTSVTKVKGLRAPEVEPGVVWFGRLTESQQRAQMGHAAFEAWKNGQIQLRDFVGPYHDDVFGTMIGTRSLKNILAGVGGEYDFIPARADFLTEASRVVPGMIDAGLDSDVAMVMADFLGYTPEGDPIWNATAVREGTVDLFLDIRNIGRRDPSIDQVDVIRQRAAGILASDGQLARGVLSAKERKQLEAIVSRDYDQSTAAILGIRDLRLTGSVRVTGGYTGDSQFVSAQDADSAARLLEMRLGRDG